MWLRDDSTQPGVDYGAVALAQALVAGDACSHFKQAAEERCVCGGGFGERGDMRARHNEDVHGGLGVDVGEGVAIIVLIDGGGRNGPVDDFAEEAAHDGSSLREASGR